MGMMMMMTMEQKQKPTIVDFFFLGNLGEKEKGEHDRDRAEIGYSILASSAH
jgi:hypothetical protein